MNETQAVSALSALAHAQRLRVFRALVIAGPEGRTPSVLAEQLDVAGLAAGRAPCALGDNAQLAALPRQNGEEAVGLPEVLAFQDNSLKSIKTFTRLTHNNPCSSLNVLFRSKITDRQLYRQE